MDYYQHALLKYYPTCNISPKNGLKVKWKVVGLIWQNKFLMMQNKQKMCNKFLTQKFGELDTLLMVAYLFNWQHTINSQRQDQSDRTSELAARKQLLAHASRMFSRIAILCNLTSFLVFWIRNLFMFKNISEVVKTSCNNFGMPSRDPPSLVLLENLRIALNRE